MTFLKNNLKNVIQLSPPEAVNEGIYVFPNNFFAVGQLMKCFVSGFRGCGQWVIGGVPASAEFKNLVMALTTDDWNKRLGNNHGLNDVLNHPAYGLITKDDLFNFKIEY